MPLCSRDNRVPGDGPSVILHRGSRFPSSTLGGWCPASSVRVCPRWFWSQDFHLGQGRVWGHRCLFSVFPSQHCFQQEFLEISTLFLPDLIPVSSESKLLFPARGPAAHLGYTPVLLVVCPNHRPKECTGSPGPPGPPSSLGISVGPCLSSGAHCCLAGPPSP